MYGKVIILVQVKMLRHYSANAGRIWQRCTLKKSGGPDLNVCFVDLPRDRIDELVEFKLKFYVQHELTHRISGLPKNKEAVNEFKPILKSRHADPATHTIICCEEKDNKILPNIIGSDSMKLIKRGEPFNDEIPPNLNTKEAKDCLRILRDWNRVCSVPSIMERFDVESFYEDLGAAVHRDYIGYGIVNYYATLRRKICQAHGVPMAGAWMTSMASEKVSSRSGWELAYEISREDLEKVLQLRLDNSPPTYKFRIIRA